MKYEVLVGTSIGNLEEVVMNFISVHRGVNFVGGVFIMANGAAAQAVTYEEEPLI